MIKRKVVYAYPISTTHPKFDVIMYVLECYHTKRGRESIEGLVNSGPEELVCNKCEDGKPKDVDDITDWRLIS